MMGPTIWNQINLKRDLLCFDRFQNCWCAAKTLAKGVTKSLRNRLLASGADACFFSKKFFSFFHQVKNLPCCAIFPPGVLNRPSLFFFDFSHSRPVTCFHGFFDIEHWGLTSLFGLLFLKMKKAISDLNYRKFLNEIRSIPIFFANTPFLWFHEVLVSLSLFSD